jgi:hypothetical protein
VGLRIRQKVRQRKGLPSHLSVPNKEFSVSLFSLFSLSLSLSLSLSCPGDATVREPTKYSSSCSSQEVAL